MSRKVRTLTVIGLGLIAPFLVAAASQTIAFPAISNQILGVSPFVITAIASSGLPVSFASTTPGVCKLAGDLVTLLSVGPCFITASQAGNGSFDAATPVTRSFTVSPGKPAGALTAAPGGPFLLDGRGLALAVTDFNGDGIPDAAVLEGAGITFALGDGKGGFTLDTTYSAVPGIQSFYAIVTGDFNGDGFADVAVSNAVESGNIFVLLGNGAGGFTAAPGSPFSVGAFPEGLVVGDFNGDGIQDLATLNQGSGSVTALLGYGTGGFAAATGSSISGLTGASLLAIGDFNEDGIQDLAVETLGGVAVFLGNGSSGFTASAGGPFGVVGGSMIVDDFNQDGHQDLAVANPRDNNVAVLLGDGNGGFAAATGSPFSVGEFPYSIAAGDFNGDGIPDLATSNSNDGDVTVLLGNGSGGFTSAGTISDPGAEFVMTGDFNGDGIQDLAVVSFDSENVTVLLGGPAVAGAVLSTSSPAAIVTGQAVALTLTVSDTGVAFSAPTGTAKFYDGTTLLGTSNQNASPFSFSASGLSNGSHSLTAVYSGDSRTSGSTSNIVAIQVLQTQTITFGPLSNVVLGSGNVTLAASASSGNTVSYAASPQGVCTVSGASVSLAGFGTCSITASQAGDITYAAATPVTQMFTISPVSPSVTSIAPNTVQAFSAATPVTIAGSNFLSGATVAMTGPDGVTRGITPDLIQAAQIAATIPAAFLTTAGTAQVVVNNGFAALSNPVSFTITAGNQTIAFDAVPNQILGVSPIVIAAQASSRLPVTFASTTPAVCTNATNLVTLVSTGTCSITSSQAGSSNYLAASAVLSFTVSTAKVSSSFMVAAGSPFATGTRPEWLTVGDFNGDGIPDIATANGLSNNVTVMLGNGSGGFTQAAGSPFAGGAWPNGIVSGDFNGDGFADLAVSDANGNNVTVLLGNGTGGFTPAPGSPFSAGAVPGAIATGDFNADGIQDLVVANGINSVTVLLGNGSGGFVVAPGGPIAVGQTPVEVVVADFNGDGIQDIATSNAGSQDVSILLGNGTGGFSAATFSPIVLEGFPGSLVVGDFNGDGLPDIAVADGSYPGDVKVLLRKASGGFGPPVVTQLTQNENPGFLVAGDFNGDGVTDLASVSAVNNSLTILTGTGTGTFVVTPYSPIGTGAGAVVTGDFNGDGIEDIAVGNILGTGVTVELGFAAGSTPQSITFGGLSDVIYGVAPFAVTASASSGLAVSFASMTPTCSVAGATVTILAEGPCSIVAGQAGNATYAPAPAVTQTFTVNGTPQTVTFGPLSAVSLGTAPFTVSASASSGLPITFSSTTNSVCTVSTNGTVTILGLGTCSIMAAQYSTTYAIASVTQSFPVVTGATCGSVTISPNIPVEIRAEGTREQVSDVVISCNGGNGLPMNVSVSISPTVNITSLVLGSGPGAISESLAGLNATATTLAPGAVSGVVSGNSVTFTGVPTTTGAFTITATNIRVNASQITGPLPVFLSEAIQVSGAGATPAALPAVGVALAHYGLTPGGPPGVVVPAAGASAIPVCTVISPASPGFYIPFGEWFARAFKTQGSSTTNSALTYWYTGNTETGYSVSLNGVSNTATSGTRVKIVFNNIPANVTVYVPIAVSNNGGTLTLTASETGAFAAVPASTGTGVPAGTATLGVTNGSATAIYEVTSDDVTTIQSYTTPVYLAAAAGTVPAQAAAMTATVGMAPIGAPGNLPNFVSLSATTTTYAGSTFSACGSSITFPAVSDQAVGAAVTLTATATSGVPVTYASTTPGICSVAGNVATMKGAGQCSIAANAAANSFYSAAPSVSQSFNVTVVAPVATSITPNTVTAYSGPASVTIAGSNFVSDARISFTPPGGTTQTITPSLVAAAQLMATIPAAFLTTAGTAQVAVTNGFTAFSNQVQFTITQATQTMSFDAIPNQILGGSPFFMAAKASSSLPVGFASSTSGVCKVAANQVRLVTAGSCSITATQAGNAGYAAVSATQSFLVSQSKASGTLTAFAGSSPALAPNSGYTVTADFNGDGIPDIATINQTVQGQTGSLTLLLGNGSGGFKSTISSPWPTGTAPFMMMTGDFNNDGIPDLVTSNGTANGSVNNITVLLGDGAGNFTVSATISTGRFGAAMAGGDFNGDGMQDIVYWNYLGSALNVLFGDGSGGFSAGPASPITTGTPPNLLVVADFNSDGIQDLAAIGGATDWTNASASGPSLSILLGNGAGRFTPEPSPIPLSTGTPGTIITADFNGDGVPDLAVLTTAIGGGGDNLVTVLIGYGNGTFKYGEGSPIELSSIPSALVAGDFNGDGVTDFAVAEVNNDTVNLLLGNGHGAFTMSGAPFVVIPGPVGTVAADFNGDGIMDLATVDYYPGEVAGDVTVFLGGIARTESFLSTTSSTTIAVGQPVPLVVTLSGTTPTFAAPTGTVDFSDGTTVLGTASQNTSPYTFTASGLGLGTYKLSAIYSGDNRTDGSATNTITIQVLQAQTISFAALANVPVGTAPFALTATTSSGYTVSFTSNTPNVCSLSGNTLTTLISGGCSVTATQAGDSTYAAAVPVTQKFTVFFGDVASGDNDYSAINAMAQLGITAGCGSNGFCPNVNVTRDQMAIFIVRAIYGNDNFTYTTTPYFTDVTPSTFGFKWIQKLRDLGITGGCRVGAYCPGAVVTRDQMAVFIIRARLGVGIAGASPTFTYPSTPYFTDVSSGGDFPWIQRMKMDNITAGCAAGEYCPAAPVTRGQMAIFIMRGAFNQFLPAGTPVVSSISPSTLDVGTTGTYTITGTNTNFAQGTTTLSPIPGVTIGAITVNSATSMTVQLTAASTAVAQPYSILAITGSEQDVLPNGLILQ